MAKGSGMTKRAAETALESVLKSIRDSLKKGKKVTLVGFGTFSVARRAARNGRNPRTGRVIRIPAAKVPRFKAGKDFKNAVN
jgi:DNA-binding protein HU-beta